MWFFILTATLVFAIGAHYVVRRFIKHVPWAARNRRIIWFAVALFMILQLAGPALYRGSAEQASRPFVIQWLTYTTLGLFACLFFYTLVADLALWSWRRLTSTPVDVERRAFFGVGAMSVASVGIGAYQALEGPRVYETEIPVEGLPEDLDGFRLVQISDLHVGPIIDRAYATKVVDLANSLRGDIVALTGDFVDGAVEHLRAHIAPLAALQSRYGTFYVTGNHEYYWDGPAWIEEFKRLGANVLHNEHRVIDVGQAKLVVAGIPDRSAGRFLANHESDAKKALHAAPDGAFKILLAHQPQDYAKANEAGFDLQLSGHTHGGQFFPWGILVAAATRYYKGLNRHGKMWIYVNRGTGFWGPPLRFLVPSEVSLLKLKRV